MRFEDIPTPSYVIDEKKLRENLEILKEVREKSGAKILLAQKAYSAYQTYPLIAEYLDGTTASGIYEARLAYEEFKVSDESRKTENHVFEPAFKDDEIRISLLPALRFVQADFFFNSHAYPCVVISGIFNLCYPADGPSGSNLNLAR